MKRPHIIAGSVAGLLLLGGAYRVYIAYADLVTLNVQSMDVRQVVRKLERQTWETILLHTNVAGTVTLNVRRVPLPEVLNIISLQTSARWTAIYPIYRAKTATAQLEKVVRGEIPAAGSGWTNLEKVANWQRGAGTAFGNTARSANHLVSAQIENKDVHFAALALSRFSQAQVVAEDSALGTVNLKLEQAPFKKAVSETARQVHRKWTKLYALQPRSAAAAQQRLMAASEATGSDTNSPGTPSVQPAVIRVEAPAPRPPDPAEQARHLEALFATMSPEERAKAEEQITTMQQIQALPEAERQQRLTEIAAASQQGSQANLEQRVRKRLRDGTVEQRVARDRETLRRKQQPQAQRP